MGQKIQITAILIIAMAAGYIGGLMGQTNIKAEAAGSAPKIRDLVRAKRFELEDSTLKTGGVFGTGANGESKFVLLDSLGKVRGAFCMSKGEPSLAFGDAVGKTRGMFGIIEGVPSLTMWDRTGRTIWTTR